MKNVKLTFTFDRFSRQEVLTDACQRKLLAQQREAIIDNLNSDGFSIPLDSCWITSELFADLVKTGRVCKI